MLEIFRSTHSRIANSGSSEKYSYFTQSCVVFIFYLQKLWMLRSVKVGQILLRHPIVLVLVQYQCAAVYIRILMSVIEF